MAVVSVATSGGELLAPRESLKRDIQPLSAVSDEKQRRALLKTGIRALVGFWENLQSGNVSNDRAFLPQRPDVAGRELWRPYGLLRSHGVENGLLPSYEDCIQDLPPDYTATDSLANAHNLQDADVATNRAETRKSHSTAHQLLGQVVDVKVDFTAEEGFRTHAKKKAKKAAAASQRNKWADNSGDEGEKEGGADGADGGGGDDAAGGDAGGGDGGGEPPGGGDDNNGDDGDDWYGGGGKKNKKKKKKNAWEVSVECERC